MVLPDAIQQALERRTELTDLREQVVLQKLNVVSAKSGYKPTVSGFCRLQLATIRSSPTPAIWLHEFTAGMSAGR